MPSEIKEILSKMTSCTEESASLILRAYNFAAEAHEGVKRYSGEPYLVHAVGTAKNLAAMRAEPRTIAAGLIHDTISDGSATKESIEKEFGNDILFLVSTVTDLGKIQYRGEEAGRRAESLRRLFVGAAKDVRVLLIKLADRLHNIETLEYVPEAKRSRIALETIEIFAPIANRLGMGQVKGMLEDGSFAYAFPKEFSEASQIRQSQQKDLTEKLERVKKTLLKKMAEEKIVNFQSDLRIKHLYSLYRKLERKDMDLGKIHDLLALRIIVNSIEECYKVLGIIHNTWRPLPGELNDYIAVPKINGYQSIHTTIFTGDGGVVEIQIRTHDMHNEAEYGISSHIAYDESGKPLKGGTLSKKLNWIRQLIDWQRDTKNTNEFIESLKTDFFQNRIFVFTPKGDVIELPFCASPVDFAYAVHSWVGNHMSGAKVNGKIASFDTELKSGDIVEIVTREKAWPTSKWFEFVKTALAKKQIRLAIAKKETEKKIASR
ncbi:MAG: RelA/SpoT family protein [Candidatus Paceibacterota bacterium]|jgi:GTP pyrophosphokinase